MLNIGQLLLLHNLINNWRGAAEGQYQPTQEELGALRWFLYMSDLGEVERMELVRQAIPLGLLPGELVELRRLADRWLY